MDSIPFGPNLRTIHYDPSNPGASGNEGGYYTLVSFPPDFHYIIGLGDQNHDGAQFIASESLEGAMNLFSAYFSDVKPELIAKFREVVNIQIVYLVANEVHELLVGKPVHRGDFELLTYAQVQLGGYRLPASPTLDSLLGTAVSYWAK